MWGLLLAGLLLVPCAKPVHAQVLPPAFAACDTRAFLFQGNPTNVFSVDLVTGADVQVGTAIAPVNINAAGYNPLDGYLYGMNSAAGGTGLYRIGANFAAQLLGYPAGLPTTNSYLIGDFDNNGQLWLVGGTTIYQVDMRPGSATHFSVVGTRPRPALSGFSDGADWAFNPVDSFLYRFARNTTTNRLHLIRYNRLNGVQVDRGAIAGIAADATIAVGAAYADSAGFVYASDNTSGRIFRVNTVTVAASLLSTGPIAGNNDGARCFNAPVPIDFGDAPASYGTLLDANGARHAIPGYNAAAKTAPLMLGGRLDADADGQPGPDASLDRFEDAVDQAAVSLVTGATTAQVIVRATNAKATAATIAGWIDFNGNGSFDAAERAQVAVPASTNSGTAFTLNWAGLTPIPAGFSGAARVRIATAAANVANPIGSAADGEVEDYILPITQPLIGCSTDPSVFNTGISAGGGILPPGSRDRNWEAGIGTAAGGPASVGTWIDAWVTGNAAPGAWADSPFGNAEWTSFYANATHAGNVDEFHRYRFTLDSAVDPASFVLAIDFYSDNSVWEVYVNGQPQSGLVAGLPQDPGNPYFYGGFTEVNRAQLELPNNWQSGSNELVVKVRSAAPRVGFLGQVTSTSLCPTQIAIDKSVDPPGVLTPGGTVIYTVTATNSGLVDAPNTIVTDAIPVGIASGTWTCAAASGALCPNANGTLPLNQTLATFPGGGVVTYTITATVDASPPISITNTANATPPTGGTCYPDDAAPPCAASVTNPPVPIVSVAKTSAASQAVPGGTLSYEIVVRNVGSTPADGTTISDPVPAGLSGASWTCTASGSAVCANASGSGAINETVAVFPPGGELTYVVTATVDANPPAIIANTASATPPGGGICSDGSAAPCDSTVVLPAAPQIGIAKSANPAGALTPGGTVTYTITVSNGGSVAAPNTVVSDDFPAGIDSATWTCVAAGGAVCPNASSGGVITPPQAILAETIATFPVGGSVTYTVIATVAPAPPASIDNTAQASAPGATCLPGNTPAPCTASVANPIVVPADFGDAPDSYGTLLASGGAHHFLPGYDAVAHTAALMLGALVDSEADGVPGSSGDGDDVAGVDDEDALSSMPPIASTQTSYGVMFPVHNTTDAAAEVTGWIDWNRNGTFEAGEASTSSVPDGATSASLTWSGFDLTGVAAGSLQARLRIAPAGEIAAGDPTGSATAGEVEDHTLTLSELPPDYFLSCPATAAQPPQDFTIREMWRSPDTQVPVYQTPLVGDLFGNGQPVVVVGSNDDFAATSLAGRVARNIRIYRGSDGTLLNTIATPYYFWSGNAALALADVDNDGQGEILLKAAPNGAVPAAVRGRLIAYRNDGTQMWVSDQRYDYDQVRGGLGINLADFNGDGIAEVYVGSQIFNARTGVRLASVTAASRSGCPDTSCIWGNTTAADLDGDGQLELVAGDVAYKVDITNPNGDAGNSLVVWRQATAGTGIGDGWTAIADIDLDGAPDVVVVRSSNGGQNGPAVVYVWDPQTGVVKGAATGFGTGGSQPFVGDIDGDGTPEIVLTTSNRLHAYTYAAGTGLALKWTLVTTDDSALTTLAMFDFNSDGVTELVYRDTTQLRIIDGSGAAATNLATFACQSGTGTEMPVIADLDGSGEARIITTCGDASISVGDVRVFASDSFPWAETRPVWNQQAYFVTHVDDDLTIPAPQFPHWTSFLDPGQQCSSGINRPLNSFQQQVTSLDPNTGCPVICAPPEVDIVKALIGENGSIAVVAEPGEQLTYTITLTNNGGLDAIGFAVIDVLDANVSFVSADNGGTLVGGNVEWTGLLVPAVSTMTLTVVVQVNDPIPSGVSQIGNVAYDPTTTIPDCSVTPTPPNCTSIPTPPEVTIAKALTGENGTLAGQAEPGEQLTYTITLTNAGGSDAVGYAVTDDLDPNVVFVSADHGGALVGGDVVWTGLTVPAAGSLTLTVVVTVIDPVPAGVTQIGNVAYETGTAPPDCSITPLPTGCVEIPVIHPPLQACTAEQTRATERWWFFGNRGGIDFGTSGTSATAVLNPQNITTPEGSTVVTDFGGQLLFWSNAGVAYNRNHMPMQNGGGLLGNPSATQTVAAFPALGSPGRYFIVTTDTDVGSAPNGQLRYSVVDMNLDGGLGGIVAGQKNIPLGAPNSASEALTAVPNADGSGFWVLTFTNGSPDLLAYQFDGAGPVGGVVTSTLSTNNGDFYGSLYFNKQLNALAQASGVNTGTGQLRLLSFDAANGIAHERFTWSAGTAGAPATSRLYTADFSPAGDYLYVTRIFGGGRLFRYRIAGATSVGDIVASEEYLGMTGTNQGGHVRRGADGRMYVPGNLGGTSLNVVNTPDDPVDAGFVAGGFALAASSASTFGLPQTVTGCPAPTVANVTIDKALTGESGALAGQAEAGEQLTYTITLTNTGGSDALNYGVTDALDPNVAFVSADNGGALVGGNVEWNGLTVPAAGNLVLTVVVQVVDPIPAGVTQIGNVAYETGTTPPACPPAGGQCVIVPVEPNVAIAKALTSESGALAGQAEAGEQLTYTITLTNSGGVDATGYGVTDGLDPNVVFVSADNGGALVGGNVEWNGLTVPAAGNLVLTVVVQVVDPIPAGVTQIGNVAYETGTTPPACPPAGGQCVIVPVEPNVAIAKALTGESGALAGQAEAGEQLTYTITLTNTGGSDALNYGVTDSLDPNVAFVSADNGGALVGGNVEWNGLTVPAAGNLVLTVVVQVVDPIPADVTQIGNVAYETGTTPPACPPAGGQCVIVPTEPSVALAKSASAPAPTGNPNEYAITYVVTANNSGGSTGHYDLADTLAFNGATVTAISTPVYATTTGDIQDGASGAFAPPAGGTIVTNESISAGGSESWTYTVTYTVVDGDVASDCSVPNGGLRNHAELGGDSVGAPPAETCSGAPSVAIVKTATAPAPTGNPNEFALIYTIDIANSGSLAGVYDLSDTLAFNGVIVGAVAMPFYSSATDVQDGTLGAFAAPTGGTIVTGESISPGGAERWRYTVVYTVIDAGTAQDCADPAGGLRNSAQLGGSFEGESNTCTGAPAVVIGKSVSGPGATGNPNEYTLDYLVTVQNDGSLVGTYDLADTFTFAGVTVTSVSAVVHGGADPLAGALGTLTPAGGMIVSAETIAAGTSETYAYSVTFTVDDLAAVGTCATGGGLVNQAELGGSSAGQVGTCSDLPDLVIAKSAGAPTPTGMPNQFTIAYTVNVDNAGAAAGSYDLDDVFTFAGATIDAVSAVSHVGPDPLGGTLGTLTAAGGTVVSGETIAAGSGESFVYAVTFTLTDPAAAADCTNPVGGLRNAAALGGSATGDAQTCTGMPNVILAKALAGENGAHPGVAEPGEQLTYTITLSNTGGTDATGYGVTDQLDPNTTFVSADNGGVHATGLVTWSGLTVPANGTLVLSVVVAVVDPLPAGVTQVANVAFETGTTPPACPPAGGQCVIVPTEGAVTLAKALAGENGAHPGVAEPGEQLTYTITLTNTGGTDATGYGVTDQLDPNTTFVSADNGGVHAAGLVTWSGLTVPANGALVLTVVVAVADPLPAGVTQVANVAFETGTTPPACPPSGPQCVVVPVEGAVMVSKSVGDASGNGEAEAGEQLTYTITLANTGGSDAVDVGVTDPLDPNTAFVSADHGGTHAAGTVSWAGLVVPAGGTLQLTVVVVVADPLPAGVTRISNLAYETGTTSPDCDALPRPANCVDIPVAGLPHLMITKTADSNTLEPGGLVVYTISVANDGDADAIDALISDPLPAGIVAFAWTCSASGGATCPNAAGTGAISEAIASFPVGGMLVYSVTATLSDNPPGSVVNTATVTPGGDATCGPDNTAPPCPATVIGTVVPSGEVAHPVPTLHAWTLLLLMSGMLGLAWRGRRRFG